MEAAEKIVIHASLKADVARYYRDWLLGRLAAGSFDLRKGSTVHRFCFSAEEVEKVVIWSRNPRNVLAKKHRYLSGTKYPFELVFEYVACDSYMEPTLENKDRLLKAVADFAQGEGKGKTSLCYGPVYVTQTAGLEYHAGCLRWLCAYFQGHINRLYIAFDAVGSYSGRGRYNIRCLAQEEQEQFWRMAQDIAQEYGYELYRKPDPDHLKDWEIDVALEECCPAGCKYCLYSQNRSMAQLCLQRHEPSSGMIAGHTSVTDKIKIVNFAKKKTKTALKTKPVKKRS